MCCNIFKHSEALSRNLNENSASDVGEVANPRNEADRRRRNPEAKEFTDEEEYDPGLQSLGDHRELQ